MVAIRRVAPPTSGPLVAAAGAAAVIVAGATVVAPLAAVALLIGVAVGVAVFVRPVTAAYLTLFVTPLVTGIDRDKIVPLLRPNEALVVLVGGALVARGIAGFAAGRRLTVRFTGLDAAAIAMATASSVIPVLWLLARGRPVTAEDLLYSLTLWKYLAVYAIVRVTVTTREHVRRAVELTVVSHAAAAVVAILQGLQLFGVPQLLGQFYAPFGDQAALDINRGTSLLASSHATADVLVVCLAITLTALVMGLGDRRIVGGLSGLFLLGTIAAGQFSGVIGLVVALGVVGAVTGRLTKGAVMAAPVGLATLVVMQPVIERRLEAFSTSAGLPQSWQARLDNLNRFFWPELFRDFHWVLGVRPSTRVPGPEWWREWVWIESGHTWLLWNGGVPLVLAYVAFVVSALARTARAARRSFLGGDGVAAVVTTAACAAVAQMTVLTLFDPHLTLRGAADLLFALLALAFCRGLVADR